MARYSTSTSIFGLTHFALGFFTGFTSGDVRMIIRDSRLYKYALRQTCSPSPPYPHTQGRGFLPALSERADSLGPGRRVRERNHRECIALPTRRLKPAFIPPRAVGRIPQFRGHAFDAHPAAVGIDSGSVTFDVLAVQEALRSCVRYVWLHELKADVSEPHHAPRVPKPLQPHGDRHPI